MLGDASPGKSARPRHNRRRLPRAANDTPHQPTAGCSLGGCKQRWDVGAFLVPGAEPAVLYVVLSVFELVRFPRPLRIRSRSASFSSSSITPKKNALLLLL